MPTSATRDGSSAGSVEPVVGEPLRRPAEGRGERHPVDVAGRARLGRVEVAVGIDPDHAARLSCGGGEAGEGARSRSHGRRRARAGSAPSRTESSTSAASARAGLEDLGQVARALVVQRERLGLGCDDVAAVGDGVADLRQPLLETRVADRRRAHVDAAPRLAEVERGTDDRDGRRHGAEPTAAAATVRRPHSDGATLHGRGEVAQLVEHTAENRGVAGSSPALAIASHSGRRAARIERPIELGRDAGAAQRGRLHGLVLAPDPRAREVHSCRTVWFICIELVPWIASGSLVMNQRVLDYRTER